MTCQHCGKSFTRKGSLRRHMREVHHFGNTTSDIKECGVCPVCKNSLPNYSAVVVEHLKTVHSIDVEVEKLQFSSLEGKFIHFTLRKI